MSILDATHMSTVFDALSDMFASFEREGLAFTYHSGGWGWSLVLFRVESEGVFTDLSDAIADMLAFRLLRPSSAVPLGFGYTRLAI